MTWSIQNPVETLIGAGVLTVAVVFGIYAGQVNELSAPTGNYHVKALFRSANGVSVGTDVRIAGVKVGSVSDMSLDPKSLRALVTLSVKDEVELTEDTLAKIDSEGLLGSPYVALEPGGGLPIGDGDEIEYTQGSVSFTDLLMKLGGGLTGEGGGDATK